MERSDSPQRYREHARRGTEKNLRFEIPNSKSLCSLRILRWLCLVLSLLFLASCQKGEIEPVAIAPEDMCSFCKMAISEKRYAAEFIDSDGQPFKFDDIGCMVNFIKGKGSKDRISVYFVTDFNDRQWIKASDAYYVHSTELKTPMGGQLVAFKDKARATEAVGKYHGQILRFDDLFNLKG